MKRISLLVFCLAPFLLSAQLNVAYHQSNLPAISVGYEFFQRLRPELRLVTDISLDEFSFELLALYDIQNKESYEFYTGLGVRLGDFVEGVALPIGLNIYPFEEKSFGFLIEARPILNDESALLGSFGIRYRFNRKK